MHRSLFLLLISISSLALAQSKPTLIETGRLRAVSVLLTGEKKARDLFCNDLVPGSAKVRGSQMLFTPLSFTLQQFITRKASSTKINLQKRLIKAAKIECRKEAPESPSATPTPTTPVSPPPSASPTPFVGNFDQFGDVTAAGKAVFQIPAEYSANVERGKRVYQVYCVGCHAERVNRTYPDIDFNIRRSPMLYDDSQIRRDSELADLVAYLNRFRF